MVINLVQLPAGSVPSLGNSASIFAARQSLDHARRTGGTVVGMIRSARQVQSQLAAQSAPRPRRLDVLG